MTIPTSTAQVDRSAELPSFRKDLREYRELMARILRMVLSPRPGIPAYVLPVAAADLVLLDKETDSHYASKRTVARTSLGLRKKQATGKIPQPQHLHLPSITVKEGSDDHVKTVDRAHRWLAREGMLTLADHPDPSIQAKVVTYDFEKIAGRIPDGVTADTYRQCEADSRPRCQQCSSIIRGARRSTKTYCDSTCRDKAYRARKSTTLNVHGPQKQDDAKCPGPTTLNVQGYDAKCPPISPTDSISIGTTSPQRAERAAPSQDDFSGEGDRPAEMDLTQEPVGDSAGDDSPGAAADCGPMADAAPDSRAEAEPAQKDIPDPELEEVWDRVLNLLSGTLGDLDEVEADASIRAFEEHLGFPPVALHAWTIDQFREAERYLQNKAA